MANTKEKTPEIRFKGFDDEWENKCLNKLCFRITRKNSNLESKLPLTISSLYGLVDQYSYFNNRVASENITNYYLIKKGEFAYNKSSSDGFPVGSVKRLELYEMGVLSTLYIVFGIKDESLVSDYLVSYFNTSLWFKQVLDRAAEGARNHGLLNIATNDFLSIFITKPKSTNEQKKVANFFHNLDTLISNRQKKLESLKNLKKACLIKMFPQSGSKVSEIRFKEDIENWICESLGEGAKEHFQSNKFVHHQNLLSLSYGKIVTKNIHSKKGLLPSSFDTYQIIKKDIIVFRLTDLQNDKKSLRVAISKEEGIISPAYICVECVSKEILPDYLYLLLHSFDVKKVFYSMGDGMRQTLSFNELKVLSIFYPPLPIQQKIVKYFQIFDTIISTKEAEIEKLQNLKKACLSKMFV